MCKPIFVFFFYASYRFYFYFLLRAAIAWLNKSNAFFCLLFMKIYWENSRYRGTEHSVRGTDKNTDVRRRGRSNHRNLSSSS